MPSTMHRPALTTAGYLASAALILWGLALVLGAIQNWSTAPVSNHDILRGVFYTLFGLSVTGTGALLLMGTVNATNPERHVGTVLAYAGSLVLAALTLFIVPAATGADITGGTIAGAVLALAVAILIGFATLKWIQGPEQRATAGGFAAIAAVLLLVASFTGGGWNEVFVMANYGPADNVAQTILLGLGGLALAMAVWLHGAGRSSAGTRVAAASACLLAGVSFILTGTQAWGRLDGLELAFRTGPWHGTATLFSGLGSFAVLFVGAALALASVFLLAGMVSTTTTGASATCPKCKNRVAISFGQKAVCKSCGHGA